MLHHGLVLLAAYLQVTSAKAKLEKSVSGDAFPLDYSTSMRVIRDALHAVTPAPVVVSEGANTMDNARSPFTAANLLFPTLPPPPLLPSPSTLADCPPLLSSCPSQLDVGLSPEGC